MIHNQKPDGTKYQRSTLERKFERIWLSEFPDLDLTVELMLIPGRRCRSDYTHIPTKTVIEIHGGQYQKISGHKGSGATSDSVKSNKLTMLGYRVFTLWTVQVERPSIVEIGLWVRNQLQNNKNPF